jgi:hypothetical protein
MTTWIPATFPSLWSAHPLSAAMSSILDLHANAEGFTCVAHAVSKGRRCENKLDISKRDLAASKLADAGKRIQQAQDLE